MELDTPPPQLVPYGLRAMKAAALADGALGPRERATLSAAQRVFGVSVDLDKLAPIRPEALAGAIASPHLRRQIVQGMIVVSLIDGDASAPELEVVERFAAPLGVSPDELRALRRAAEEHAALMRFDLARRLPARPEVLEDLEARGFGAVVEAVTALAGAAEDPVEAARYGALGGYPAGSLGRAYHDLAREGGFPLPGERGPVPDAAILHDLTHVLSGYGTDPAGEVRTAAFRAGARRLDPWPFVFFVMIQFHAGIRVDPGAEEGIFDPDEVMTALGRGAAMRADLDEGWDPWAVMERPLEELRGEYGILPLSGRARPSGAARSAPTKEK